MKWIYKLQGIPWVSGGKDLDGFDCLGLVNHIQSTHYGHTLPMFEDLLVLGSGVSLKEVLKRVGSSEWLKVDVDKPIDGDCILFTVPNTPVHIGVVVNTDQDLYIIHSVENSGVVLTKFDDLGFMGWSNFKLYRHIDDCTSVAHNESS